jgi:hypothetical protein
LTSVSRRACAEAPHAPPGPPSPRLRQKPRVRRPRTPSIDECPARPPRLRDAASDAGPATDPETLPPRSGFRHSFASRSRRRGARPCRLRALFTPGRTWPRAARRLLQSNTIRKHDRRTYETPPSSRAARLSPRSPSRVGSRSVSGTSLSRRRPPIGSRGFTGQGPFERVRRLSPCPLRLPPATICA